MDSPNYGNEYSDDGFWKKVTGVALKAGRELIEKALWLYYAAQRPETPTWAKGVAFGALGYFISPIDLIPDITPVLGYTDDLGVVGLAIASIAAYINDDVKRDAARKLDDWFGG